MPAVLLCLKGGGELLDIKKVDDKPMEIHTKKKSKLHINRPREGTIKGNGVYTKRSIKDVFDEKDASIKIKKLMINLLIILLKHLLIQKIFGINYKNQRLCL